jgi:ketosteroid isomerase-like protein
MAQTGTDLTRMSEELLDAFNRSDWDRMRAMIAPDLVYIETGTGRRVEGADAYIELAQGWKRAFPDTTGTCGAISRTTGVVNACETGRRRGVAARTVIVGVSG